MTLYFTEIDGVQQSAEVTKVILYLKDEITKRDLEIERYRKVLHQLACLGNGDTYGNSIGNDIARRALEEIK